jgi:hypothetical protein
LSDGGTITYVMQLRPVSNLSAARRRSRAKLAEHFDRATCVIDAAAGLIRSFARLVGALTALVVVIAILCTIAGGLW